jgi:hypothetical protein
MKQLIIIVFLFITESFAQTPCDYSTNVSDSIGTYKSTRGIHDLWEKTLQEIQAIFFYSLADDGTPILSVQLIQK